MGFLAAQCSVVVIGNGSIDVDPHVGAVPHQRVSILRVDSQTIMLDSFFRSCIFVFGRQKILNALLNKLLIPAGVQTGLLHHFRVIRVDADHFIGKIIDADRGDLITDTFFPVFVAEIHSEFLADLKFFLDRVGRQGIRSVNPDRSADPIQYLCLRRFDRVADNIRHISPERLVFFVTRIASDPCVRIGQRRSVIDFGSTSGPDNERCGVYYQAALSDHDILEMVGDIFACAIADRIFGDRI